MVALRRRRMEAEREQGITIDCRLPVICHPTRRFIVTDSPAMRYTCNMATAASPPIRVGAD